MLKATVRLRAVCILISCNGKLDTTGDVHSGLVRGIAVQHDVTEAGVVDQPRDLTAATFQSHSLSGIRTGIGTPDGRFELPVAGAAGWLQGIVEHP